MNKVYHIKEYKSVVYTYAVYADSKLEALRKFDDHFKIEEIGMDPAKGEYRVDLLEIGPASDTCSECQEEYSPKDVRDYLCLKCSNGKN